jgi:hypothetical protein
MFEESLRRFERQRLAPGKGCRPGKKRAPTTVRLNSRGASAKNRIALILTARA